MSTQHVSLSLETAVGTPEDKTRDFQEFLIKHSFCRLSCQAFTRATEGEPEQILKRMADLLLVEAKRHDIQFQAVLQVGNTEAKLISSACPY